MVGCPRHVYIRILDIWVAARAMHIVQHTSPYATFTRQADRISKRSANPEKGTFPQNTSNWPRRKTRVAVLHRAHMRRRFVSNTFLC